MCPLLGMLIWELKKVRVQKVLRVKVFFNDVWHILTISTEERQNGMKHAYKIVQDKIIILLVSTPLLTYNIRFRFLTHRIH